MDTNKMREQFEEALIKMHMDHGSMPENDARSFLEVGSNGYTSVLTKAAWWGWQASREAVVVELPSAIESPPYACFQSGWNDMRGEAVDAIEAQGLKVKP